MKFLSKIPWARVVTIIAGAAGTYESIQGSLPPWAQAVGGFAIGLAVNAERVMAKRKQGDKPFDTAAAQAKVEKMR